MKYVCISIILLVACGNSKKNMEGCFTTNSSVHLRFIRDSGNCGPITNYIETIGNLPKCDSIIEVNECKYELIDICHSSYEELYLDFSTYSGLYYLETEDCNGIYNIEIL